jgi:hypothetical protein
MLFMLRRFGPVNVRFALMLQDQVIVLEGQFRKLDRKYGWWKAVDVNNGTFSEGEKDEKDGLEVLEKLRLKLVGY